MDNLDIALNHGLSKEEYQSIVENLGREPNLTEIGVLSVMWSEHCSYKSSRIHLKKLPTKGTRVIQGPGENAGIVDLGDGICAVFKMESHNHPSYIEPYQGAATGVGGILRDIFTMGARPIAVLDSLRFGDPSLAKTRYLVGGVVSGIAGYGNCIGIPTVGGEIYFDRCYDGNPLVNVMALGVTRVDEIFKGYASGVGNPVMYVGSKTGRDGIHGAVMASDVFSEESEEKRPAVQVGDPFTEKLLLEACMELFKSEAVVGIQDMGAAGLTSSSTEMADRAKTGITLNTDKIPCREKNMTPYEILLSESQERMLIVIKKGMEHVAENIFRKWELDSSVIGYVSDTRCLLVNEEGKSVCKLPIGLITEDVPAYDRPFKRPEYLDSIVNGIDLNITENPEILGLKILSSPNICNKRWVFEQYDHMVRTNSTCEPGSDSAIVRIKGTSKSIALTTNCNSRYCYANPMVGSMIAVSESARNLACSGAVPLALTDCLNFGNPQKPEIMWQFRESIDGIARAATHLNTPVVSGNVSLYNETESAAIYPTPIIGMIGLIEDSKHITNQWFKNSSDIIILMGKTYEELGCSEFLNIIGEKRLLTPPGLDLFEEEKLIKTILELIQNDLINSAHDLSEGGLFTALAESCFTPAGPVGVVIDDYSLDNLSEYGFLFSESQSRVLVSLNKKNLKKLTKILSRNDIIYHVIGKVGGERLKINNILDISAEDAYKTWDTGFLQMINKNAKN